jgi:lipid-binding SYLF domain-containing protein
MANKVFNSFIAAICMIVATALVSFSQDRVSGKLKDAAHESEKAAEALREIMNSPDKAIPSIFSPCGMCRGLSFHDGGGFIIGAQKGEGVVSCRTASGWSAPVFLDLSGGSVGAQIGGQSTDYVLLFMNRSGVDHLLKNKFSLGGEASVAAGPVGREAGASTDWKLNAQILSYSRSRGLFAGIELKGVSISTDGSDMRNVYGDGVNAKEVLLEGRRTAPEAVRDFPRELARYSSNGN